MYDPIRGRIINGLARFLYIYDASGIFQTADGTSISLNPQTFIQSNQINISDHNQHEIYLGHLNILL
jgi:hypothetical protein